MQKGEFVNIMEKDNARGDCSIIVSSCDTFSDAWEAFFTLFFKYWSDCPFPIYLISETKEYNDGRVKMINIGEDKKWATNMKNALKSINTENIIYLQEDYLIESMVDTGNILRLLNILRENNATYLKLYPSPKPTKKFKEYADIGEIVKGDKYSISLQASIWDKKKLESILIDGESGWDMEFKGSARSVLIKEPFLSVYDKAIDYFYATAIKKGVWFYDAIKLCEREGVKIDKTKRRIETFNHYFLRRTKILHFMNKIKIFLHKLKKYLRIVKKFFGKEYKKTYSQAGEDIIIQSALRAMNINKIKYLDIGAHHPFYLSNTYLFYKNGDRGVCVEPDPYLFKYIQKKRSKDICLNIGIGINKINEADFYIMSARTLNTFSKEEAEKVSRETKYRIESKIKIPLESINEIINKYFETTPNFISLDVEGLDMEILRSFDFNKYRPEIFCVETISFTDDNTGVKENDIIEFMLSKGYFVFADTYINTIFVDKEKWIKK